MLSFIDKIRNSRAGTSSLTPLQRQRIEHAKRTHLGEDTTPDPIPAYLGTPIVQLPPKWQRKIEAVAKASSQDLQDLCDAQKTLEHHFSADGSVNPTVRIAENTLRDARYKIEQRFATAFSDELVACAKKQSRGIFNATVAHLHTPDEIRDFVVGLIYDTRSTSMRTAPLHKDAEPLADIVNGIWTDATLQQLSASKDPSFPDIHDIINTLIAEKSREINTRWRKAVTSQPDVDLSR